MTRFMMLWKGVLERRDILSFGIFCNMASSVHTYVGVELRSGIV